MYKVTYISPRTGLKCKKDFSSFKAMKAWLAKKGLTTYKVWHFEQKYSKA